MLDKRILDFISGERVCVMTTLLKDESPHAAALHFSHKDDPLKIFVATENTSKKCESLLDGKECKASLVIGFDETEMKTFQMDGVVKAVIDEEELKEVHAIHYGKLPDAEKWKDDPATIFLEFTPSWWRYSDYKTDPKTFISS